MPVTIELPAPGGAGVVRPMLSCLAELGAALHVLTRPHHHHGLADWRDRVLAAFTPRLTAEFEAFKFLWDGYRANFLLVPSTEPAGHDHPDLDEELAALAALPDHTFAAEALQPLGTELEERVLPGHHPGEGPDQLLAHARARSRAVEATTTALLRTPGLVRERLVAFLAACGEAFFVEEWERMRPTLRQAVGDAAAVLDARGPMAVLAGLTHGIHEDGDDRVVIDKSFDATIDLVHGGVLRLLPSLLCHPHVIVQSNPDWPYAIQYPVARRAPRRELPPLEVTARRLEALADPSRLELAALVAREGRSTGELAALSGLTAPTVSRHLKVLRDAGLVRVEQQGHFRVHQLDLDVVEGLGSALVASLLR